MYDWDDLRLFLAATRAGTLAGAAQRLGIDAATVGRRLARLETALKSTLFVRSPSGIQLTAAGARLLVAASEAEAAMEAVSHAAESNVVGGTVRISASEGFGTAILAPALPALHAAYPTLWIELAAQPSFLSPTKREVDVVVTLAEPKGARLVVEPLTDYHLGLYASAAYLKRCGTPESAQDLQDHDIVGYMDDLVYAEELRYLEAIAPNLRPSLSSSSIRAQHEIIANAGGIGVLPCFLVGSSLKRVLPSVRLTRRWWLGTHRDVVENARTKAVHRWLRETVAARRAELLPPKPRAGR
ncbi:MAG: LysR family transcriptional regulator [Hyphomonadaceae bacterium JAD_PAG50586_4]|nr:MAG: LysR family transcriptional regulator [Hyphomonadaceae bacterium JAD_PAG50586_4]